MKLRTEVERIPLKRKIGLGDKIFMVGSCFTGNIGGWLAESWLPVTINPWGVLYNPASIAAAVLRLDDHLRLDDEKISGFNDCESGGSVDYQFELVQNKQNGLWCSFDHHGIFDGKDPEAVMQTLNYNEGLASKAYAEADHVIVTFGTSWVFERQGRVVANCHKFPASEFTRRKMSVDEIVETWSKIIESRESRKSRESSGSNPKHFVFTVSPIRHVADGLHGNELSKATLLLAVDELCCKYPDQVEYLPSYELLIDDLRDYRFYAEDMVHPSTTAVAAIKELVADTMMTPDMLQYMRDAEPIVKAFAHRPNDPDSPEHREFIIKTEAKRQALMARLMIND